MDEVQEALAGIRASIREVLAWAAQEGADPVVAVSSVLLEAERAGAPPEPVLSSPPRAEGTTA